MNIHNQTSEQDLRWQRRKEARPEEIVAAALKLFTDKGFSATRMIDVAEQAGISKGTLYIYFKNKEAILKAVVEQIIEPLIDRDETMAESYDGSATELLKTIVKGWWFMVSESNVSGIPKLIISESGNFPELAEFFVDHIVKRSRRLFARVIQRGIDSGELKPCDANMMARLIVAPLVHAAIWTHSLKPYDDELDIDEYIEQHIEVFLHGITNPRDSSK